MKKLLSCILFLVVVFILTGCEERKRRIYDHWEAQDTLTVKCNYISRTFAPKEKFIIFAEYERYMSYDVGSNQLDMYADSELDVVKFLVVDGQMLDENPKFDDAKAILKSRRDFDKDGATLRSSGGREAYRNLMREVAPQKMEARKSFLIITVLALLFLAGLILIYTNQGELRGIKLHIVRLSIIGLPAVSLLYLMLNPYDSLWFVTDFGWFSLFVGFWMFLIIMLIVPLMEYFAFKALKHHGIFTKLCILLGCVIAIIFVFCGIGHFWDQGRHIFYSFLMPYLLSGFIGGASVGDFIPSSGEKSDFHESINFSGRTIGGRLSVDGDTFFGNDGNTYHRNGTGSRSWDKQD